MDLILWGRRWALVCILAACRGQSTAEEDEKRPYKFAFNIEGYQHRSEEKDERGIIMGEYGFVTGDGVYHVTVYATDENGNFKILKTKNFYIGLPGEGTTAAPSRAPPPTPRVTTPVVPTPSTTKSPIIKHLEGLMGCSGCIVPNKNKNGGTAAVTTTEPNYGAGLLDDRLGGDGGSKTPGSYGGGLGSSSADRNPANPPRGSGGSNVYPGTGGAGTGGGGVGGGGAGGGGVGVIGGFGGAGIAGGGLGSGGFGGSSTSYPGTGGDSGGGGAIGGSGGGGTGQRPTGGRQPGKSGVPGGGSGNRLSGSPNYSEGLPPGMTMEDLMALLYKFNYTLKYHGHHETGYRSGDKEGGYFFNGRDGFGRNVKYIANEFGYQPNITLVDLGLQAPDTPQGENEENELRGNEFKWFYNK